MSLSAIPGLTLSALLLAAGGLTASPAAADSTIVPVGTMPGPLKAVRYDQRLGEQVPLGLPFVDDAGKAVKLGDYLGSRPAVLILAYYRCPMLCDMVMQAAESGLKPLSLDPGKDFDVIVASIDPADTPERATMKKRDILQRYGRPGTEKGWHFLTGPQSSIHQLANAVGFQYVYDPKLHQFAHAAGIVLLTPAGRSPATCSASSTRRATCGSAWSRPPATRSAASSTRSCSTVSTTIPRSDGTAPSP